MSTPRLQCELPHAVLVRLLASGLLSAEQLRCLNPRSEKLLERSVIESCYQRPPLLNDAAKRR